MSAVDHLFDTWIMFATSHNMFPNFRIKSSANPGTTLQFTGLKTVHVFVTSVISNDMTTCINCPLCDIAITISQDLPRLLNSKLLRLGCWLKRWWVIGAQSFWVRIGDNLFNNYVCAVCFFCFLCFGLMFYMICCYCILILCFDIYIYIYIINI